MFNGFIDEQDAKEGKRRDCGATLFSVLRPRLRLLPFAFLETEYNNSFTSIASTQFHRFHDLAVSKSDQEPSH